MKALSTPTFVILLLAIALPVSAHHAWPTNNTELVTVKGTVIEFRWANPHPMMTVEVQNAVGQKEIWEIGGPAINRMEANGWNRNTVKPGDVVTGIGYQFADRQKIVKLERIIMADGKEMRLYGR
jgi:hypothetical protein